MTENNTAEFIARQKELIYQAQGLISSLLGFTMYDAVKLKKIINEKSPDYPTSFKPESIADMLKLQNSLNEAERVLQQQEDILNAAYAAEHAHEGVELPLDPDFEAELARLHGQAQNIAGVAGNEEGHSEAEAEIPKIKRLHNETVSELQPKQPLAPPPPPENSLGILESMESPLVEIFASGPWFPEGKGRVTVGSKGFDWYKNTDPFTRDDYARAGLPTGFYWGEARPTQVVLRLETCILVWDFNLNVENMLVYIAGVSDVVTGTVRWLKGCELSASLSARFVRDLLAKKRELA
jgi:hypothetical protein